MARRDSHMSGDQEVSQGIQLLRVHEYIMHSLAQPGQSSSSCSSANLLIHVHSMCWCNRRTAYEYESFLTLGLSLVFSLSDGWLSMVFSFLEKKKPHVILLRLGFVSYDQDWWHCLPIGIFLSMYCSSLLCFLYPENARTPQRKMQTQIRHAHTKVKENISS